MKADLLGMANQTFPEAAEVWQSLRRNSNALRDRTHEAVGEYIVALTIFFKGIVMSSINPGMVRACQLARRVKQKKRNSFERLPAIGNKPQRCRDSQYERNKKGGTRPSYNATRSCSRSATSRASE